MLNQWTHNLQIRFWGTVIELLPRVKLLVKLVWSVYHLLQGAKISIFLLKICAIAAGGFFTGVFLYLLTRILQ